MFVNDTGSGKFFLEAFGVEHFLEQILEAAVIGLENRVLGGQIDRPAKVENFEVDFLTIVAVKTRRSVPGPGISVSVARYWSPKA